MNTYVHPDARVQCGACGEIWDVTRVANVSCVPMQFCPSCGGAIAAHTSSFDALVTGPFAPYRKYRDLEQLLYETWRSNDYMQHTTPQFIDYLRLRLRAAIATNK